MPSPHRLVIAAGDPRHAATLQSHLQRALEVDVPIVRFEDVPRLLSPEADGELILFAQDVVDYKGIETVVRETRVQRFTVSLTLVESESIQNERWLDHLTPYLSSRWSWPGQIRELTASVRRESYSGTAISDAPGEALRQRILHRLSSQTPSLIGQFEPLRIAALHDVPVLIEGETGTGKSLLARFIHEQSPRAAGRFLTVSCGSYSSRQFATELFGLAQAMAARSDGSTESKLAAASDGTILLEEIETLAPDQQINLLRVLETGEYEPLGGGEPFRSTARIMASTNWNLTDAVDRGTFRRDLYCRLQVVHLRLPPLRHRPEDIGPLAQFMVARFGTKYGKSLFAICPEALAALEDQSWPGNIRQLEHVIQQAVLSSNGNELKIQHFALGISSRSESPAGLSVATSVGGTLKQSRESSERANILRALEKARQSRTHAAKLLGVSRVTLYKKMKKYGLFSKLTGRTPLVPER